MPTADVTCINKVLGFAVNFAEHTEYTRAPDPDDEWDRGSTCTTRRLQYLELNEYPDVTIPKAVFDAADELYYVYIVENSGDSFGSYEGSHVVHAGLYADKVLADSVVLAIQEHAEGYDPYSEDSSYNSWSVVLPDGQTLGVGYNGYFDSLASIECITLVKDGGLLVPKE